MRTTLYYKLTAAIFSSILLFSCDKETAIKPVEDIEADDAVETVSQRRLSASNIYLSSEDAITVVELSKQTLFTKSNFSLIKDVVTLPDEEGVPAVYVVNLDDGFVLVSGHKTSPPILAEVSKGSFSAESEDDALSFLIGELTNDVIKHKSDTLSESLKMLWSQYEEKVYPEIIQTRTYSTVWDAIGAYMQMWREDGFNVYVLNQQPPGLLNSEYEFLCSEASNYERDGYDYMDYSYITEKVIGTTLQKGPYLTTSWGREYPYYSSTSGSFNDGTLAVGQLMKYYEYPNSYFWDQMPDYLTNTPNSHISYLLSSIESSLSSLQSSGQTKPNSIKNYLYTNYYSSISSHNTSSALSSINNRYPFIMTGENSSGSTFAWCCDGYKKIDYHDEYTVWVIADSAYPDFDYEVAGSLYKEAHTVYYYHINWGDNGSNDGWFSLSGIDYSSNIKDIIVNGHR